MGTPAFPELGKHCAVRECNLVDFLPFTCDACQEVFCLEHRTYGSHKCPRANAQDVTVLVCPICAKGVRLVPLEDPNVTWDRHVQTNCDPTNYTKKPRCIADGCKELLTFSNKVRCKDCGREVCLKHRFGADHNCQELRKADAAKNSSFFGNNFFGSFSRMASLGPSRSTTNGASMSSTAQARILNSFHSAASTVEKNMTKLGATTNDFFNTVNGSVQRRQSSVDQASSRLPSPAGNSSARELCPQCGARFSSVSELIQHAESVHATGQWRLANSQEQLDVCPKCGRGFSDAIALVNHVERDHGGTSSDGPEKCVIS